MYEEDTKLAYIVIDIQCADDMKNKLKDGNVVSGQLIENEVRKYMARRIMLSLITNTE
jgi:hypothetical protein